MPLGMSRVWSYPTNQGSHWDTPPESDMVALAIACCVKAWKNIWNKPVNPLYFTPNNFLHIWVSGSSNTRTSSTAIKQKFGDVCALQKPL